MTTTWRDQTRARRQWAMSDGSTITEPDTEISESGIRVRLKGATKSFYAKDYESAIVSAIDNEASARGVQRMLKVVPPNNIRYTAVNTNEPRGDLNLLRGDTSSTRNATHVWWHFRHQTLPVHAFIGVIAAPSSITTRLGFQPWIPADAVTNSGYDNPHVDWEYNWTFGEYIGHLKSSMAAVKAREFVRDNPPTQTAIPMGSVEPGTDLQYAETLLKTLQVIDDYETLQVPDLSDPENPGWLTLELYDSNFSGDLYRQLTDYIEDMPGLDSVMKAFEAFRTSMRVAGIEVGDLNPNGLARAIEGGCEGLIVSLGVANVLRDADGRGDNQHSLHLDLANGAILTACSARAPGQDDTAYKWEEQLLIAQMTGRETEFLGFAKHHALGDQGERAQNTLKARRKTA